MKPSLIKQAILSAARMDHPLFIWGPPGVGKSDTVRQAAGDYVFTLDGRTHTGANLVDFRMALRESIDMMGLPHVRDGKTAYAVPADLPFEGVYTDPRPVFLFLDELPNAPPQTQAAGYQLVLDRAIGAHRLVDRCVIIAAGNRANDRGVVHRMPDPLVDRFIHVDYEPDLNDWCAWAQAANVLAEVVAFIRFRSGLLFNHETTRQCHAFATPRGWAAVSRILTQPDTRAIEAELIRGRVGAGAASEFIAFLKLYRNMISPDDVISNPKRAQVPDNVAVLYALAEALARRATGENFAAVLTYARRMPREYAQCLVSSAIRITPALCNTPPYIDWVAKEGSR